MDDFFFKTNNPFPCQPIKDYSQSLNPLSMQIVMANSFFRGEEIGKRRMEKEYEESQKMHFSKESLTKIKEISRDVESNLHGLEAEEKVHSYLNPGPFAAVFHYELKNVYLIDEKGMSHEIDFIEIRETGVFCIEVKNWSGNITGKREDSEWIVNGSPRRNPTRQNDTHIRALHDVIGKKPHITSMVVFGQNNVRHLNIPGVICLSDFRSFMNKFQEKVISRERMKEIYDQISSKRVTMTRQQHVQNIKKNNE